MLLSSSSRPLQSDRFVASDISCVSTSMYTWDEESMCQYQIRNTEFILRVVDLKNLWALQYPRHWLFRLCSTSWYVVRGECSYPHQGLILIPLTTLEYRRPSSLLLWYSCVNSTSIRRHLNKAWELGRRNQYDNQEAEKGIKIKIQWPGWLVHIQ